MASQPDITFIDRYIADGKLALMNMPKFYDSMLMTNKDDEDHIVRIPLYDMFIKYREHFRIATILYQMPEVYKYKPKMVSLELYGTTELWLALLRLNSMRNISEFNSTVIKVYDPKVITDLINIFFVREKKR